MLEQLDDAKQLVQSAMEALKSLWDIAKSWNMSVPVGWVTSTEPATRSTAGSLASKCCRPRGFSTAADRG